MSYFDGLFLGSEDFSLEQNYNIRMRRLHNRHLHTNGIVHGLEVEGVENTREVIIKPGFALDRYFDSDSSEETSRELIIKSNLTVIIPSNSQPQGGSLYLWIYYKEQKADQVEERGGNEPIHWMETVGYEISVIRPIDDNLNVILARIQLDDQGFLHSESIDYTDGNGHSIRTYSGFSGKRVETATLTLSDPDISESYATLDGFLFDDDRRGIWVNSPRTHLTGNLEMEGSLHVNRQAQIEGTLSVSESVTAESSMHVVGPMTVDQGVSINDQLHVTGDATLLSSAHIHGALNVDQQTLTRDLIVENKLEIQGSLQIAGGTEITEISTDGGLSGNSNEAIPTEKAIRAYVDSKIAEYVKLEFVGGIMPFAVTSPPSGWLECNGKAVSRSGYPVLFNRIGTNYGAGDGSTTFNLPDLRGVFLRGWDHGRGADSGRSLGSYQSDQMQGHKHNDSGHNHSTRGISLSCCASPGGGALDMGIGTGRVYTYDSYANLGNPTNTSFGSIRYGSENRPINVSVMYCIKY